MGSCEVYKAHINGNAIQSCQEHCKNTANYSKECLESVGLANTGYLCGLLHDAGKCTEEFNAYIEAASRGEKVTKGSVIHTFAGLQMVLSRYHSHYNSELECSFWNNLTSELIAIAIGSHHGQFDVYNSEHKSGFDHRFEKQPAYDKKAAKNFYNECFNKKEVDESFGKAAEEIKKTYYRILELLSETSSELQTEEMLFYLGVLERLVLSALIEGDRRDTAEFMSCSCIENSDDKGIDDTEQVWERLYNHLRQKLDIFPKKTPIQCARREMSDYCETFAENPCGIYRLNLPTGAGKTLSGLRYALVHAKKYKKKRVIFAIPLLSILDQNANVIRDAVGDDSIILEHHSNVIQDGLPAEELAKREMLIDTWESPIIITTLVQLLNTMFEGKTSSIRRFHSLADSVVVIDEVQSVPIKMLSLFNLTINFLSKICNTTFLLCSATQPLFELNSHKLLINEQEVIPADEIRKYRNIFKRTEVQYIGNLNADEIINKAEEYYQQYGSVLLICNTKKETNELYNKAKSISDNCIHLSTAMCMAHRKAVISSMMQKLKNKESLICVSTQLIEAGVDVSFGAVIRLAAGIDNVAQAAGRGNRNGESDCHAPVGIAYLKGENLSRLKEIKLSQDVTGELIAEYKRKPDDFDNDLISDKAIKFYYEKLFRKINETVHSTDYCIEDGNLFDFLSYNMQYAPENAETVTMRQAFKTAGEHFEVFDNVQTSVITPYGDGEKIINDILSEKFLNDIAWSKKILNDAKEYVVNLFDYQVEKLNKAGAIYSDTNKSVLILNPDYYDEHLGVITEKGDASEWDTLIL